MTRRDRRVNLDDTFTLARRTIGRFVITSTPLTSGQLPRENDRTDAFRGRHRAEGVAAMPTAPARRRKVAGHRDFRFRLSGGPGPTAPKHEALGLSRKVAPPPPQNNLKGSLSSAAVSARRSGPPRESRCEIRGPWDPRSNILLAHYVTEKWDEWEKKRLRKGRSVRGRRLSPRHDPQVGRKSLAALGPISGVERSKKTRAYAKAVLCKCSSGRPPYGDERS
ncbi:hypothetical protein DPX16_3543 [Anabarilius grahami]|uniref:Uncharacterized protein n=1 Tax=Anabarilius grahami TaxID=495550 RepID=A0A3N0YX61_ANAGA|nr:hypothetical protein DPX16_3543 [Anabarilius grahami]